MSSNFWLKKIGIFGQKRQKSQFRYVPGMQFESFPMNNIYFPGCATRPRAMGLDFWTHTASAFRDTHRRHFSLLHVCLPESEKLFYRNFFTYNHCYR